MPEPHDTLDAQFGECRCSDCACVKRATPTLIHDGEAWVRASAYDKLQGQYDELAAMAQRVDRALNEVSFDHDISQGALEFVHDALEGRS